MGKEDKLTITEEMIAAGVAVYSNPGRYETYEETVTRIFCSMALASSWFEANQVSLLDMPKVSRGEPFGLGIGEGLNGPNNDILLNGPNLNK